MAHGFWCNDNHGIAFLIICIYVTNKFIISQLKISHSQHYFYIIVSVSTYCSPRLVLVEKAGGFLHHAICISFVDFYKPTILSFVSSFEDTTQQRRCLTPAKLVPIIGRFY